MEEQEGKGKNGKKRGTQETTGSIRKQQVRVRKREETSFAQAISVQTARCLSALPKVISLCVAPLRLRKPDHGPQGVECRGRFVKGIMEADFDGSSSAVDEVAAQRVPAPNERLQQKKVSVKDRANSGFSRSLRLPQQPQARVRKRAGEVGLTGQMWSPRRWRSCRGGSRPHLPGWRRPRSGKTWP